MQRQNGFTLLEVMITIAIIAILVAIAVPSYTSYVTRSKIQEGTSALLGMRVKMEQYFQDNRFYVPPPGNPVLAPCTAGSTVPIPAGLQYFTISCPTLTASTYTIRADGTDPALVGLRLEINEANQRWTRAAPGAWGAWTTTTLPLQCWVTKLNGSC